MRYLSVCSGMEAASVAWHPLGWKPVGFSEIEPFPCAILKHRFPDTPNYGSLTEYQSWPLEPGSIDLLVGGTPCQSFSVAGLRKGLEDPRGNLALVFLGLADKLKPRWIVWENVPGVLSSNGGRDLGSFLGALVQLGYGFAFRVLDAQHFGVPQRRRRVFVVACLGDWHAPAEVLLEPDCVRRDPSTRGKKGQGSAAGAEGGVGAGSRKWPADTACTLNAAFGQKLGLEDQHALGGASLFVMSSGQANAAISNDIAHTLNATHETQTVIKPIAFKVRGGGNYSGTKGGEVRPDEKGGTGFLGATDKTFTVATVQDQWVAAPIPYRKSKRAQSETDDESWVEGDVSNTLNNFDLGDTRTTHAVVNYCADIAPTVTSSGPPYSRTGNERVECEAVIVQASELRLRGQITEKDVCPTLTAGAKQGDTDPLAVHPIAFQPGNLRRQGGADPSSEVFPTLTKDSGDQSPHVAGHPPMAVRRLTPVECERLQGFPDNWSRIPWKGKPEEECPDGPRYKACGNSMAVPVMRWIGERIAKAETIAAK